MIFAGGNRFEIIWRRKLEEMEPWRKYIPEKWSAYGE
jgi:hypothetical protein